MSEFSAPDFSVPELQAAELMMPDFTMPDAALPDPPTSVLTQPIIPAELDLLAGSANPHLDSDHPASGQPLAMPETPVMPVSPNMPDKAYDPTQDMPGTLASSALSLLANSPDDRQLPSGLVYDALNSTPGMSTRERHLGMLLPGLEGKGPQEETAGSGQ